MPKDKWTLSKERAKNIIAFNGQDMAHTFYNAPFGLIGADHSKKSLFEDIDNGYACKKTGKQALDMGHGLVIVPSKECNQGDLLFVETKSDFNKMELKRCVKEDEGVKHGRK